jgi:DNA-binding response OmpR family regulator
MRRRLHALYASAQVFRIEPLANALRESIQRLDAARDQQRGLRQDDLDALATLAGTLPVLGGTSTAGESSAPPPPVRASAPVPPRPSHVPGMVRSSPTGNTMRGMQPASEPPPAQIVPEGRSEGRRSDPPSAMKRPSGTFTAGRASEPPPPGPSSARATRSLPETVVSVLVLDGVESQAQVRAALPAERFEVLAAADPEEALRIARSSAPDVVLADRGICMRPGVDFISRLRSDPLTDFVPVVLLVPQGTGHDPIAVRDQGADEALAKPMDPDVLIRTLARVTGTGGDGEGSLLGLGEMSVSELSDRIAYEIRRGLVESLESGRMMKIPMGDGSEVLAAAWSAVARVRQQLVQRSGGRVRFRDVPRRGGPALLALVGEEIGDAPAPAIGESTLARRRIIVADDDPAVVWFFAGILREAGAEVIECADGREAIDEARARRPDLIVSDILMPRLDGFGMCRELSRDPALSDVPVILLSWKEDLLQRMRELQAHASGYLRKEAGSAQILQRVREALRPLARLESELRTGGEVRGRVEGLGVIPLLRTVAREGRGARVTVRDAWNLFEVDIRGGNVVHLTRTATDGSFSRGEGALPQLLGLTAGRYTVVASDSPIRGAFKTELDETLRRGTRRLGAVLDAVSGTGLVQIGRVEFDEEVMASVLRTSPEPVRELVQRMAEGASPRDLLLTGKVSGQELEAELVDLARRGALRGVTGLNGEDRIKDALAAREAAPAPILATTRPPPMESDEEPELSVAEPGPNTGRQLAVAAVADFESQRSSNPPLAPAADIAPAATTSSNRAPAPAPATEKSGTLAAAVPPPASSRSGLEVVPSRASDELSDLPVLPLPHEIGSDPPGRKSDPEPITLKRQVDDAPEPVTLKRSASGAPTPPAPAAIVAPRPPEALPRPKPGDPKPDELSGPGPLGVVAFILVLALLGYIGYRVFAAPGSSDSPPPSADPPSTERTGDPAPSREPTPSPTPGTTPTPALPGQVPDQFGFGRLEPGITPTPDLQVAPEQGLLVVEAAQGGTEARIRVDDRDVGVSPLRLPLSEGAHDVAFRRGDETRFRRILIKRGHTRIVPVP